MTVLIVDDDEMVGRSLVRALRRLGHSCRVARSVDAAMRALALERPDLVLTDFDLAECCTGADLACWSRNAFHVPVVLMTAHDPGRVHDELADVGMPDIDVLSKPFSLEDLALRLVDALAAPASPRLSPSDRPPDLAR